MASATSSERRVAPAILGAVLLALVAAAGAEVYQRPSEFLAEAFAGDPPSPERLWLSGPLRARASRILGHPPDVLRLRYWRRGARTAWVLEEIGKERPITVGIVIEAGRVQRVAVLAFRESRGWEVRYPVFTSQFHGARLGPGDRLDRDIDGISGATLSVSAVTRLVRLALALDAHVRHGKKNVEE